MEVCRLLWAGKMTGQVTEWPGELCIICVFTVSLCVHIIPSSPCTFVMSWSTLGNSAKEAFHSLESKQQQGRDSSHCSRWGEICTSIRQSKISANFVSVSVCVSMCNYGGQHCLPIKMLLSKAINTRLIVGSHVFFQILAMLELFVSSLWDMG